MPNSRRAFLRGVSLASLASALGVSRASSAAPAAPAASGPEPVFPKPLKKGDTVALVRPASPSYEYEANEMAAEAVAAMGFVPKVMPNAGKKTNYLAGADAERAADVNTAFADPGVAGIWCITGGYGSSRILPYLDYATIRKNPKPFIGFSDITATHNAIHRMTGLVTFHGPVAGAQNEYALENLRRVVMNGETGKLAENATGDPGRRGGGERDTRIYKLAPGKATGRLVGGNISVLAPLIGTPYEPPLAGRILFLEEVEEDPYRIDRWLTGFLLTGRLSTLAGVALGKFAGCRPGIYKPSFGGLGTWTWQEVCADRFGKLGIPVVAGFSFGHVPENATLPIGAMAELDAGAGTLTLLEPAVR
jgi:muramoyltetrapeptide carboxypeptidase